jgi:cysteine desulfurase/selenocysteine lyase
MTEAAASRPIRSDTRNSLPVGAIRERFPILTQRINGHPLVYLDNAATTQVPVAVLDAVRAFESTTRANIHRGVHTLSQRATDAFEQARDTLRRFVGAGDAHELVFCSGTTDALNLVANGLSEPDVPDGLRPGDEIVVSGLEHHANLLPWQRAARRSGATLKFLLPDRSGRLGIDDLRGVLGPRTRVVALTACANATGYRPPFEALLAAASEAGALTVLDAAQAVSHEPIDLSGLACDYFAFSSHKMYGPMGIGVLAGRRPALERLAPLRLGGDMVDWVSLEDARFAELPARLEGGTPNVGGAIGMAAAAQFIDELGREPIDRHVRALRARAAAALGTLAGVKVVNPEADRSAIVAFTTGSVHPHDIGTLLDARGIAVRTGHHCAMPLIERLGTGPTTRASFGVYNTADEVDALVDAVAHAMKVLA